MESGSILVDSNVYIGLLRRGLDPVQVLGAWTDTTDLVTCGMVRLEVERGLKVERVREHIKTFFDVMIMIPTGNPAWEKATHLAWSLDRRGITLPAQDCLIAACALSISAAVLTDDRHFDYIPHLKALRPSEELDGWQE